MNRDENYAFIDSQNLNLGIRRQGWRLDYTKFRIYLKDKYNISKAYLFIGYVPGNEELYKLLQEAGYVCVFKPTLELPRGRIKGNVDAELVLHTMIQLPNYKNAIIVSGDGDFFCLVKYLQEIKKLKAIIIPDRRAFSALLKIKVLLPFLRYAGDLKEKVSHKKEKTP